LKGWRYTPSEEKEGSKRRILFLDSGSISSSRKRRESLATAGNCPLLFILGKRKEEGSAL